MNETSRHDSTSCQEAFEGFAIAGAEEGGANAEKVGHKKAQKAATKRTKARSPLK